MKKTLYILLSLLTALPLTVQAQEVINNQSIITLIKAGVSPDLILAKIKASPSKFIMSTAGLVELKKATVSDSIVNAMLLASAPLPAVHNQDIIDLCNAGVSQSIITKKIQYSETSFTMATDDIITLKKAKVPDSLVKVMMVPKSSVDTGTASGVSSNPARSRFAESGLYYESGSDYQQLEATTTNQTRQGTFGEKLLGAYSASHGGLLNSTTRRAGLANKTSNTIIENNRPVFYLVLSDASQRNMNQVAESVFDGVSSPNDFVIIKVQTNNRGREIIIGRETSFSSETGFGAGSVPFRFKKISQGLYRIYLEKDLPAGEYAFLYNKGSEFTSSLKLFDFSLRKNKK